MEPTLMIKTRSHGKENTEYVFEAADPDGILIRLTRCRWERHIAVRHPEVENHADVRKVIEKPQLIIIDQDDETEHHFYARGLLPYPELYLHVPVVYRGSHGKQIAEVKTAHFVRTIAEGRIRWVNILTSLL